MVGPSSSFEWAEPCLVKLHIRSRFTRTNCHLTRDFVDVKLHDKEDQMHFSVHPLIPVTKSFSPQPEDVEFSLAARRDSKPPKPS